MRHVQTEGTAPLEGVLAFLVQEHGAILDRLKALLRLPSVSTDDAYRQGMEDTRAFLLARFAAMGLQDVQTIDGGGHPAIYAAWMGAKDAPTILIYGHYDVQPPDPLALWTTPPFEPTERDGRLYARGASDVKGSTTIAIEVVAAFLKVHGHCPVNVKFFIEGEEEIGSPSLKTLLARHGDLFKADAVISADGGRASPTIPTINVGARGLTKFELAVETADKELHSGRYGGAVRNALHEMAALVASLHHADGSVAVDALMRTAPALTPQMRADTNALPFDEPAFIAEIGGLRAGDPACSIRESLTLRPAIDVNGLWGGYTGAGSKTVIPNTATAKISVRLAPGQDPEAAAAAVKAHLAAAARPGVRLRFSETGGHSPASSLAPDHPLVLAATRVLQAQTGLAPVPVRLGATVPITALFKQLLGLDTLMFGFNLPDEDVHAPNEFFHLDSIPAGLEAWAMLLEELRHFPPDAFRTAG